MKIKKGLMLCKVGESNVILASGNVEMQIQGLTTVNETGAFIWERLMEDTDVDAVVNAMLREFDVDRETAMADVDAFIAMLSQADFLE